MSVVAVNNENQVETIELESWNKKPRNMEEMITLYMEMRLSHDIMCTRIEKLENTVRLLNEEIKECYNQIGRNEQ